MYWGGDFCLEKELTKMLSVRTFLRSTLPHLLVSALNKRLRKVEKKQKKGKLVNERFVVKSKCILSLAIRSCRQCSQAAFHFSCTFLFVGSISQQHLQSLFFAMPYLGFMRHQHVLLEQKRDKTTAMTKKVSTSSLPCH